MPRAKAGVTPHSNFLRVIDLSTRKEVNDVVEVDSDNGTLTRACRDEAGRLRTTNDGRELLLETSAGMSLRIEIDEAGWGGRAIADPERKPQWVIWNPNAIGQHQPA